MMLLNSCGVHPFVFFSLILKPRRTSKCFRRFEQGSTKQTAEYVCITRLIGASSDICRFQQTNQTSLDVNERVFHYMVAKLLSIHKNGNDRQNHKYKSMNQVADEVLRGEFTERSE